ncbi:DnaD domain protein [Gemella bergeri ATCC 700627]|uniref:DnaD domain protein n=1 Tax=Gemella bergeri ATCC 700627 TaxID=1321820 RepID=U2S229_9BACL|nr:DnaD domain protein [Gemella bergeri]ERK59808.1 DnaD domain protein [Gemella bergeri ATCC 700627]
MLNVNTNGLLVDAEFLMNYKNYNLSGEEAIFLLQINYLTEQGKKIFSVNSFSVALNMSEKDIFSMLDSLLRKRVIKLAKNNRISFIIFNTEDNFYTLKELLKLVESIVSRMLTSREIDIISSWIDRKFLKSEIDEALNISKNINYVNGILNNKINNEMINSEESENILGYDWLNK